MTAELFPRFFKTFIIFITCWTSITAYMVGNNPYHRREILDKQGKYQLEWLVNCETKQITFEVCAETLGYVGFGLSDNGKMSGADLVIGGVASSGKPYFVDYHAVVDHVPKLDPSQNWDLNWARENNSHTVLSFSREFDTGDSHHDYPITEHKITLIWSYGERDDPLRYHYQNRGSYHVYLIHPDYTPYIERNPTTGKPLVIGDDSQSYIQDEKVKVWTIDRVMQIPSSDTAYWCKMHAAPKLTRKHHIIGIEMRFGSEESRDRVHHFQLSRCTAPRGNNARSMFAPFLQHKGQLCYRLEAPTGPLPTEYCTHVVHGMGFGSRALFNPPHVGLPFGYSPDEYYILQVHYDNPERRSDLTVDFKLDIYYTSKLRRHDGGFLAVGNALLGTPPSILIPPSSIDHQIRGICGETCTRKILPTEGIRMFAITPHSHNAGRKMKLQHFRNGQELEPVKEDDNYLFSYQQFRVLNREAHILPGDKLVMNCEYDNTGANGTTVGGFATYNEMCISFTLYYNKIDDYSACVSEIVSEEGRRRFLAGVTNITWNEQELEFVVSAPHPLAGLTMSEVSDNHVLWDTKKREELQRFHREQPQTNYCEKDVP